MDSLLSIFLSLMSPWVGQEAWLFQLTVSFVFVVLMMSLVFLASLKLKNAGIVDVFWALGFSFLAVLHGVIAQGFWLREWLIGGMFTLASIRLTVYLLRRFLREHPTEDPRYANVRHAWEEAGQPAQLLMYGLFILQAVLMWLVTLPVAVAMTNPSLLIHPLEWIAVVLFLVGWFGEALADEQLHQFKVNPENRGKTCQVGLWHYSRHPNYFFEWVMWCAYFMFALATPYGWLTIFSPLLMLVFLTKITGIHATEEHAVKTRQDYALYQKTTSPFIPWFPKQASNNA